MGERKVLNKYFPPDFDPKKVPRLKRDPLKQIGVRMMIPFSMQCSTCGEFMYRGKKFNSLKEDCIGEDYLGIKRFRFYIKCVTCSQEITFKTDPEKGDYELETGATRNFEAWADKQATEEKHKKAREEEEKSDNMKALENRTLDSKIEMEIMDALDEIKAANRRHETVDTAQVLQAAAARRERETGADTVASGGLAPTDEEETMIASIKFGGGEIRRLSEDEGDSPKLDKTSGEKSRKVATDDGKELPAGALPPLSGKRSSSSSTRGCQGGSADAASRQREGEGEPSSRMGSGDITKAGEKSSGMGASSGRKVKDRDGGDSGAGSLLMSGIESQARRKAEKAMAAAAGGSAGTTIVVKRRRRDNNESVDEAGGRSSGSGKAGKKCPKPDSKKIGREVSKDRDASGQATRPGATAAAGALLGGLLGAYDSSGSDDAH